MDNRYRDQGRQGNYGRQQEQFGGSQGQYSSGDRYSEQSGGYGNSPSRERHDDYGSFSNTQYGAGDRYEQGGNYNPQNDYGRQSQGGSGYGSSPGGSQYGQGSQPSFRGDDGGRNMGGQSYGSGGGYTGGMSSGGMGGQSDYYGGSSYGSGQSGYGSQSSGGRSSGSQYSGGQSGGQSGGFIDRITDKIGSWFGDDDGNRGSSGYSGGSGYTDRSGYSGGSGMGRSMAGMAGAAMGGFGDSHRGRGPGNYKRSDERILEDACDHLTHDHSVDASNIEVTVQDGEVTLSGTVDSRMAKRRAEDCVEEVSGVKHVQNNLRVQDNRGSSMGGGSYGSAGMSGAGGMSGSTSGMTGGSSSGSASGSTGSTGSLGGVKETTDVKRDPDATNKATGAGSTSRT